MNDNNKHNIDDLFFIIGNDTVSSERIAAPRYSYWKSVFRIFFKKKSNIAILTFLTLLFLASFIMPIFWPYNYVENVSRASSYNLSPIAAMKYFGGFDIKYILGTGPYGNSILYGILSSARMSLLLAVICTIINMVLGIVIGAAWGYSKKLDRILLVIFNIVANVPYVLLITVVVYIIGSGFWSFIFALTITGWLGIAYFFRNQVMIIRDREYSLASKCLGTPIGRVISKNILPFMTSVIVTVMATELPSYISYEVYLSFIGIGLSANVPSLGRMIQQAQTAFLTFPWEFWPPVFIASSIAVVLYVLGQNLADASDPRTHM